MMLSLAKNRTIFWKNVEGKRIRNNAQSTNLVWDKNFEI